MDEDVTAGDDQTSSADRAYAEIQRLIVTGVLPAYELLSENDLTRRTGSGRTPVREALQRLKFEGFVNILPRRGVMVTPADIDRQLELLEARRPLEELMVTLAARRATEAQRDRMRQLADALERAIAARDRDRYLTINQAIHRIEAEATQNRYLLRQIEVLHGLSRRFWYFFINDTESFARAAVHHTGTLRAISDGDAERARTQCRLLLDLLESVSQRAIQDRLRTGPRTG